MELINRKEAIENEQKYYFTGIPCKNNHISKRSVNNKSCYICILEKSQKWRSNNRHYHEKYNHEYRENNKEQLSDDQKKRYRQLKTINPDVFKEKDRKNHKTYRTKHLNKIRAMNKQYRTINSGIINAKTAKRRAIKMQATPTWSDIQKIREIYQDCQDINIMNKLIGGTNKFVVDHIIPLKNNLVCGLHVPENLRIILESENCMKHNKFLEHLL